MNETEGSASITETHPRRRWWTSGSASTGARTGNRTETTALLVFGVALAERDHRRPRPRLANWDVTFRRGVEGSLRGDSGTGGGIGRVAVAADGLDRGRAGLARAADRHSRRRRSRRLAEARSLS